MLCTVQNPLLNLPTTRIKLKQFPSPHSNKFNISLPPVFQANFCCPWRFQNQDSTVVSNLYTVQGMKILKEVKRSQHQL